MPFPLSDPIASASAAFDLSIRSVAWVSSHLPSGGRGNGSANGTGCGIGIGNGIQQ